MISLCTKVSLTVSDEVNLENEDEVSLFIYTKLLPVLESRSVYLSHYGNHAGKDSADHIDEYWRRKEKKSSFDLPKIIELIPKLPEQLNVYELVMSCFSLRQNVGEKLLKETLTNGDFMMAMMLKGYTLIFYDTVNCTFENPMLPGGVKEVEPAGCIVS